MDSREVVKAHKIGLSESEVQILERLREVVAEHASLASLTSLDRLQLLIITLAHR